MKWTTSKILSFLILFSGIFISLWLDSSEPFLEALMYATITQGIKNMPEVVGKFKQNKIS